MNGCLIGLIVWVAFTAVIVYCCLAAGSRDDDRAGRG